MNLIIKKNWGQEEIIVNEATHCGKILTINPHWQCSLHQHIEKDETFFVVRGPAIMQIEDKVVVSGYGGTFRIPPFTWHRFAALSYHAKLYEFSSHHDDMDVVRREITCPLTDEMRKAIKEFYLRGNSHEEAI